MQILRAINTVNTHKKKIWWRFIQKQTLFRLDSSKQEEAISFSSVKTRHTPLVEKMSELILCHNLYHPGHFPDLHGNLKARSVNTWRFNYIPLSWVVFSTHLGHSKEILQYWTHNDTSIWMVTGTSKKDHSNCNIILHKQLIMMSTLHIFIWI